MAPVTTRVASPEFVGRRRELATLADAVARGTHGDAVVALVGGDAGIGKTRLVEEVASHARDRGALVSNILGKLGVTSRTEAATVAVRLGLVD